MALLTAKKSGRARGRRARNVVRYHGRAGHPVVHTDDKGRKFIMTRARGGGTKRVYAGTKIRVGRELRSEKVLLRLRI